MVSNLLWFFPSDVHRLFQFRSIRRNEGVYDLKTFIITQFFTTSVSVEIIKNMRL